MNTGITRNESLALLEREFGFKENDFYLLELIPLIELIWADGVKQEEEMKILFEFVIKHLEKLNNTTEGEEVITEKNAMRFIHRFTHERPSPDLLKTIRALAHPIMFGNSDPDINEQKKHNMMEYCMDIAAASVSKYPFERRARIMSFEKSLLTEIIGQLKYNHQFD